MLSLSYSEKLDQKTPILVPVYTEDLNPKKRRILRGLTRAQKRAVRSALSAGTFAKSGTFPIFSGDAVVFLHILGKQNETKTREVRESGEKVSSNAHSYGLESLSIAPGSLNKDLFFSFQEGVIFGSYAFEQYKGEEKGKKEKKLKKVRFVSSGNKKDIETLTHTFDGIQITKDLINTPPSDANPTYVAKLSEKLAKRAKGVSVKILGKKDLLKLHCGGILGVGRGSQHESRLILLEYKGGKRGENPIALVGKGVTFDTGGNNIKGRHMRWMKQDLGGAATVLGAFFAIARLGIKKNVLAAIPTVENVVDKHSYFPDDILTMHNGMTVEVDNTDAEGRLILADALSYVDTNMKPQAIVDLATLTGACTYAVGDDFTAGLSNDKKLFSKLKKASENVDEPLWELPLHSRYTKKYLKSATADITNCGGGARAGTIEGGLFLQHFVDKNTPWCHLDIASVAFDENAGLATGRDVRLLIDFVKNF